MLPSGLIIMANESKAINFFYRPFKRSLYIVSDFFSEVCDAAKLAIVHRKVHIKIGDHP